MVSRLLVAQLPGEKPHVASCSGVRNLPRSSEPSETSLPQAHTELASWPPRPGGRRAEGPARLFCSLAQADFDMGAQRFHSIFFPLLRSVFLKPELMYSGHRAPPKRDKEISKHLSKQSHFSFHLQARRKYAEAFTRFPSHTDVLPADPLQKCPPVQKSPKRSRQSAWPARTQAADGSCRGTSAFSFLSCPFQGFLIYSLASKA